MIPLLVGCSCPPPAQARSVPRKPSFHLLEARKDVGTPCPSRHLHHSTSGFFPPLPPTRIHSKFFQRRLPQHSPDGRGGVLVVLLFVLLPKTSFRFPLLVLSLPFFFILARTTRGGRWRALLCAFEPSSSGLCCRAAVLLCWGFLTATNQQQSQNTVN